MSCTYWNGPCRVPMECNALGCRDIRMSASQTSPSVPLPPPLEPAGGNLYRPHRMMIDSGTFWRCAHGVTGMGENGEWIGCKDCEKADPEAFARWHGKASLPSAEPVAWFHEAWGKAKADPETYDKNAWGYVQKWVQYDRASPPSAETAPVREAELMAAFGRAVLEQEAARESGDITRQRKANRDYLDARTSAKEMLASQSSTGSKKP